MANGNLASLYLKRLQFYITRRRHDQLRELGELCGGLTFNQLFDEMVTLMDWAVNERRAGFPIGSRGRDVRFVRVLIPTLEYAAPHHKRKGKS